MKFLTSIIIIIFPLLGFAQATDVSCFGECDGSVNAQPFGGVPPYTFLWSPTGQTTQVATGLCFGIHEVAITDSFGQLITVLGYLVNTPDSLIATTINDTILPVGDSLSINIPTIVGGSPQYNITWSPNLLNCNSGNCVVADSVPQTYIVTVIDSNGCSAVDSFTITGMLPTAITEIELKSLKIYPNPTARFVYLEADNELLNTSNFRLTNIYGKEIPISYEQISSNKIKLNLKNLSAGIYFVSSVINSVPTSYKIIVK